MEDITKQERRYAIYLRKSRADLQEKEIDVLERHRKILLELAASKNIEVASEDIFEEVVSGDTIEARPKMQQLLKNIEKEKYKAVLVMEIERLARGNTIDQGIISRAFEMTNTLIITPQKVFDTSNNFDNEFLEFGLFMSRREYKAISRRMQTGRIQSVKEGKYIGSITPYGYDKEKLKGEKGYMLIPNQEAENVKLIFKLFLEIQGTTKVAHKLNELQIKSRTGSPWSHDMVRNILTNPVYIGLIIWGRRETIKSLENNQVKTVRPRTKDYFSTQGRHVSIIEEDIFYKVQEILKSKSVKKVNKNDVLKNPLAGLVKCKVCGRNMLRRPVDQKNFFESIICKDKNCPTVSSSMQLIEKRVIKDIEKEFKKITLYLENYTTEEKTTLTDLFDVKIEENKKAIKQLQEQKEKICELLETGIYSIDLFNTRNKNIEERLNSLVESNKQLKIEKEANKVTKIVKYIPIIENCLKNYWSLEAAAKNKMLKSFIKEIRYEKTASGGRWNKKDMDNFKLEIDFKF